VRLLRGGLKAGAGLKLPVWRRLIGDVLMQRTVGKSLPAGQHCSCMAGDRGHFTGLGAGGRAEGQMLIQGKVVERTVGEHDQQVRSAADEGFHTAEVMQNGCSRGWGYY
jgi:hypothetical protein